MKTPDNNHDLLREALWYLEELEKEYSRSGVPFLGLAQLIIRIENEIR